MVDYDCKSLRRDGRRFFLRAGEIHYFRIARAEWHDRLMKAKLAGLNAVSTYVPWNYHEVGPGKYDFTGERDLPAFLELCQDLALGVLLRPGPYICAEWTFGGFPERLAVLSDQLRSSSPAYLTEVEAWIDAVAPLIRRYSQEMGGPIWMVQLENEYGSFGDDPAYLYWLRDAYRRRGVTLPLYTCDGLDLVERGSIRGELACVNLGADVRRHAQYLRQVRPEQPAIVSEFWAGWFDTWGYPSLVNERPPAVLARSLLELLAYFDGYSIYMWSGGTNFGNTAGCTVGSSPSYVTTSYDYGAPVGETGELRDWYFSYRQVNLLGMALEPILAAAGAPRELPAEPGVRLVERSATEEGTGRVIFAFNDSDHAAYASVGGNTLLLRAGECAALVEDLCLPGPVKIAWSSLPLVAVGWDSDRATPRVPADRTVVVIGYLSPGTSGRRLSLRSAPRQPITVEEADIPIDAGDVPTRLDLHLTYSGRVYTVRVKAGDWAYILRVLTPEELDRTWILPSTCRGHEGWPTLRIIRGRYEETGGDYPRHRRRRLMRQSEFVEGKLRFRARRDGCGGERGARWDGELVWEVGAACFEARGPRSREVEQLGPSSYLDALGLPAENTSYFWYETTWDCSLSQTPGSLALPVIGDRALIFLDGKLLGTVGWDVGRFVIEHAFRPGPHRLAILVESLGRYNFGHHLAKPGLVGRKGLGFPACVGGVQQLLAVEPNGALHSKGYPKSYRASWSLSALAHVFLLVKGITVSCLRLQIDDILVDTPTSAPYTDRYELFYLGVMDKGKHRLVIGIVDTPFASGPVGEPVAAEIISCPLESEIPGPWKIYPESIPSEWSAGVIPDDRAQISGRVQSKDGACLAAPRYFRTFLPALDGAVLIRPEGQSNGLIWINRHWLGRYRQDGPQREYHAPASWFYPDRPNELIIFDEEGRWPAKLQIESQNWHGSNRHGREGVTRKRQ